MEYSPSESVDDVYQLNTVTIVAVTVCVSIVLLFGIIFAVLQVSLTLLPGRANSSRPFSFCLSSSAFSFQIRSNACWNQPEGSGYMKVPLNNLERTGCVGKISLTEDQTGNSDSEEEQLFIRT